MRRLIEIVADLERTRLGVNPLATTQRWLAVHAASRHVQDLGEIVACLRSLVQEGTVAGSVARWLEAEAQRHMDAITQALHDLRPAGSPDDTAWEREAVR